MYGLQAIEYFEKMKDNEFDSEKLCKKLFEEVMR